MTVRAQKVSVARCAKCYAMRTGLSIAEWYCCFAFFAPRWQFQEDHPRISEDALCGQPGRCLQCLTSAAQVAQMLIRPIVLPFQRRKRNVLLRVPQLHAGSLWPLVVPSGASSGNRMLAHEDQGVCARNSSLLLAECIYALLGGGERAPGMH